MLATSPSQTDNFEHNINVSGTILVHWLFHNIQVSDTGPKGCNYHHFCIGDGVRCLQYYQELASIYALNFEISRWTKLFSTFLANRQF